MLAADADAKPVAGGIALLTINACHVVANIRIRNMATLGGNLAHGDYQSDPRTVLAAVDTRVELMSAKGRRDMALVHFQVGSYETALAPGELLSATLMPAPATGMRGIYVKFTTGSSEERPCVGVAAFIRIDNAICHELRVAVGAVSPKTVRLSTGEKLALDQVLTTELIQNVPAEASHAVEPINDVRGPADYKRHLVGVLVRGAIASAAGSTA